MTQEALKYLKAITEAFGPYAGIELDQKAWAKLHSAIKEALAQTQEPVGFAGVKIWIGNQQVVRLLTQTELYYSIEPWLLVELNAEMCIKELKEKNT